MTMSPGPSRPWTMRARLTAIYGALFLVSGAALLAVIYVLVDQATSTETVTLIHPDGETLTVTINLHGEGGDVSGETSFGQDAARQQHNHRMTLLLALSGIALGAMALISVLLGWVMAGRVLRPLAVITNRTRGISSQNLDERLKLPGPKDEVTRLGDTIDDLLERLDNAFRAERQFIANASHELRTPLARARTIAQVVLEDPDATTGALRDAHERALAAGEQQEHIIDALLTLARGQAGAIRHESVDLGALAATAIEQRHAEANRMVVTVRADLEPVDVTGDLRLLERLVGNLVDNAIRHNRRGGFLEVVANSVPAPMLTVTNSGPEVPAERIRELTEPFRRLDAHRSARGDGHGLGLSIVKAVIDAHRADLAIMPHDGGGLRIEVTFGTDR